MNTIEEDCNSLTYGSPQSPETDRDQEQSPSQLQATPSQSGARKRMETPIRVRDMINLYNFATQKNQELERAKSIYFGNGLRSDEEQAVEGDCGSSCCNMSLSEDRDQGAANGGDGQCSVRQENPADNEVERIYKSKTTIRRTNQGARIIIDIFFDKKDSNIDLVGSRVETDIPESRILADFQQHSLAMKNEEQKQGIQNGPSAQST
ncbi:uncharacterized protein LOC128252064 [Drosophila gunungcola]|uniref:Uncharacterized protein n=1 Tax=Drosophila gunungcola TaxID=103775 RepID=A0A9Q0BVW3_9MUSC|nr:uncharacterized protein LOC128252064 [Drosophila gunungcola]KAI8046507.1 hypothetical protein M5D96_002718 [Drosophila gunungcola]